MNELEKAKVKALVNYCMITYGENAMFQGFADYLREMANDKNDKYADEETNAELIRQANDIEAMINRWKKLLL